MSKKEKNATGAILVPRPTVDSVYSHGWERMKKYFLGLFLITIIVGVVWIPLAIPLWIAGLKRFFHLD